MLDRVSGRVNRAQPTLNLQSRTRRNHVDRSSCRGSLRRSVWDRKRRGGNAGALGVRDLGPCGAACATHARWVHRGRQSASGDQRERRRWLAKRTGERSSGRTESCGVWERWAEARVGRLPSTSRGQVVVGRRRKGAAWSISRFDHAFLRENGKMRDLGVLPGNDESGPARSTPAVRSSERPSTSLFENERAFVWEDGNAARPGHASRLIRRAPPRDQQLVAGSSVGAVQKHPQRGSCGAMERSPASARASPETSRSAAMLLGPARRRALFLWENEQSRVISEQDFLRRVHR